MEKKKGLQFEKHEVKLNPSELNVGDETPPALGPGGDLPEEEGVGSRRQPVEEEGAATVELLAHNRGVLTAARAMRVEGCEETA